METFGEQELFPTLGTIKYGHLYEINEEEKEWCEHEEMYVIPIYDESFNLFQPSLVRLTMISCDETKIMTKYSFFQMYTDISEK